MIATGKSGSPLRLKVACGALEVETESAQELQPARSAPLTVAGVRDLLGRLGGTRFSPEKIEVTLDGALFMTASAINQLRREAIEALARKVSASVQEKPVTADLPVASRIEWPLKSTGSNKADASARPELVVLCRSITQLEAALSLGVRSVYVDFEDIRRYSEAVEIAKSGADLFLATPRIQKPGEQGFFRLIESARPAGVLIRNLGAIAYFRGKGFSLRGDFSLNVANPLTAAFLVEQGLERLTISYDLTFEQVLALLAYSPGDRYELTLHQHLPMFHMEHCVFAAFLSNGTDATNCGRPCDSHNLKLRDRVGAEHPVKADVGCRNTVYHARAQSGADYLQSFMEAGARVFRVELLEEDAAKTRTIVQGYRELIDGTAADSSALFRRLNVVKQLGVTSGTLTVLS